MIQHVYINSHKLQYGKHGGRKEELFKEKIKRTILDSLPNVNLTKIDVYNLDGKDYAFNAGANERAVIFANSTYKGAGTDKVLTDVVIGNEALQVNLLAPKGDGMLITSENGAVLAEYQAKWNDLYILFDVFESDTPVLQELFKHILTQWYELHFKVLHLKNSWKYSSEKEALTSRFKERMQSTLKRNIENNKAKIRDHEQYIEDYKRNLKQSYDKIIRLMREVELDESGLGNADGALLKDLDLIVAHPKVEDLHIKDGKFIVFIPKVYAYDEANNRYYIGNCRVEIKLDNADVRFFGDNPRKSYWSDNDPHPHVKGRDNSGTACLGNVSSTIAELASQNQIYALVLVCIDFLESVNTSDSAGKNIINWDRVDEEGNIIELGARQPRPSTEGEDGVEEMEIEAYDDNDDDDGEAEF